MSVGECFWHKIFNFFLEGAASIQHDPADDFLRDGEGSGGGGAGGVDDMEGAGGLDHVEILKERAVAGHGLGADA